MKEYILCVVNNDGTNMHGKKISYVKKKPSSKKNTVKKPSGLGCVARNTRAARKTPKMDVTVRKATYSKAVRLSVLTSAAARQQLIEMGGENTIDVIREFDKDMSDEELAKKTGIKASDVRVVLNRLHNYGLFSYTRVRDRDSGWYSYIWKMSENRLSDFASKIRISGGVNEGDAQVGGEEGETTTDYLSCNSNQMVVDVLGDEFEPQLRVNVRKR